MPRPIFVLPAQGVVEDRDTNMLSIFGVIDQLTIGEGLRAKATPDHPAVPIDAGIIKVLAVWMREDGDNDVDFEHQFSIIHEGKEELDAKVQFRFKGPLHRFIMTVAGFLVPEHSSMVYLRSRLRRVGSEEWIGSQDYPLWVRLVAPSEIPFPESKTAKDS